MPQDIVCHLHHLRGKAIQVGSVVYKIARDGLCHVDDAHAAELLKLSTWSKSHAAVKDEPPSNAPDSAKPVARVPPLPGALGDVNKRGGRAKKR